MVKVIKWGQNLWQFLLLPGVEFFVVASAVAVLESLGFVLSTAFKDSGNYRII